MTTQYINSALPQLTVNAKLFNVGEIRKYVDNNYHALKNELEAKLGVRPQWKKDMEKDGILLGAPVINNDWLPKAWNIERTIQHPNGHLQVFIKREYHSLSLFDNDIEGVFVDSFEAELERIMQGTVDKLLSNYKAEQDSTAADKALADKQALERAKAVLKRDEGMTDLQRDAYRSDTMYMATFNNACRTITEAAKPAAKAPTAKASTSKTSAVASLASAKTILSSREKVVKIRKEQGKAPQIASAEAELEEAKKAFSAAKNAMKKFQN